MNARRIPLIIGLVLALGTGFLILNYLGQIQSSSQGVNKRIVVAAREIPARSQITADMLVQSDRVAAQADPDSLTDPAAAVGKMALITIPAGSEISRSKLGSGAAFALPQKLTQGLRAVSVSIDKVKGVSGLLQPGDRVDVIAVPPRVGNETPKATTIVRGALVLAIGNSIESPHATPPPENLSLTTVTLALSPQQANLIALADVNTTLRLALRSPTESIRAYPVEPLQLGIAEPVAQAAPAAAPQPVVARAPSVARPAPQPTVPVIEGDRYVSVSREGR